MLALMRRHTQPAAVVRRAQASHPSMGDPPAPPPRARFQRIRCRVGAKPAIYIHYDVLVVISSPRDILLSRRHALNAGDIHDISGHGRPRLHAWRPEKNTGAYIMSRMICLMRALPTAIAGDGPKPACINRCKTS